MGKVRTKFMWPLDVDIWYIPEEMLDEIIEVYERELTITIKAILDHEKQVTD